MKMIAQETICPKCRKLQWLRFPAETEVEITCPACGDSFTLVHFKPDNVEPGRWLPVLDTAEEMIAYSETLDSLRSSRRECKNN